MTKRARARAAGLSAPGIACYERGRRPSPETLAQLARVLGPALLYRVSWRDATRFKPVQN